jgi:TrmH family RNA methyltransferase
MSSNLTSLVRNLQQRKSRRRQQLAVAEGIRLVEEALAAGVNMRGVLTAESFRDSGRGGRLLRELAAHAIEVEQVTDRALATLADTETPQGILAVIEPPRWSLDAIVPRAHAAVLVLDAVQDPGNVGTLLRTGFALGTAGAILLKGTADPGNAKVMRSGMGATFRLPVAAADETQFRAWLQRTETPLWAAAAEGTPLDRLQVPERLALVVGNEGSGIQPGIASLASTQVAIPLARGAESLNVSVAAGIILHHLQHGV